MKVLVVRYSSIGDIVLTTPVLRTLKTQLDVELHFLTKQKNASLLEHNPYVDKIHCIEKSNNEIINQLKSENFDVLIDLHHNLRTKALKLKLGIKSYSFDKQNINKWLLVNLKINKMPDLHIVDRYMATLAPLGVVNDGKGLDFFVPKTDQIDITQVLVSKAVKTVSSEYIACGIGGQFNTKKMPNTQWQKIVSNPLQTYVLLGGPEDKQNAESIAENAKGEVINLCGQLNLNQSAWMIKNAQSVITHDTGLMHIAAAYDKKIFSVWGNTVPSFGMTPYYGNTPIPSKIYENTNLDCRPCSKIGYAQCPKGHFKCMNDLDIDQIVTDVSILAKS